MNDIKTITIIGGGLGGLFTGAILAHEGFAVTVLEKNAVIGGGLQCFSRWGEVFETGMHILGGMHPGGNVYRICQYLGISDRLKIKHVDEDCTDEIHYFSDRHTYRLARGREGFVRSLAAEFPDQRENLEKYVATLYAISKEVKTFNLLPMDESQVHHSEDFMMAADEFIAKYISDSRLRDILGYMNPMYGGVAGHTPAYIHALINVLYIEGASRFVGGSQQLADALADVITSKGGKVVGNSKVTRLEINDRKVDYVETSNGSRYSSDLYISAIHPCGLLEMIDAGVLTRAYVNRLNEIPNSYSAFTVYIKLKPNAFRYINHTCYCQDDYGRVWDYGKPGADWPHGFMYMTPPAERQGEYARTLIIMTPMAYEEVSRWDDTTVGHRGKEYEEWKEAKKAALMEKIRLAHPEIDGAVDRVVTASPLTIRDYYGVKEGSMYGYRKDCRNFILSHVSQFTKVRNLMLTGQNVNLHGICGVPLTAIITAELLLGRNYVINKITNTIDNGKN